MGNYNQRWKKSPYRHVMSAETTRTEASVVKSDSSSEPIPLTPCRNEVDSCDGIYDALGICVCGSEIRTLAFAGTYSDNKCTDLVEKLPTPKIPTEACFHLKTFFWKSLFSSHLFSLKVSCIKDSTGANSGAKFQLWDGENCNPDDFVAEANVYPGQCNFGD